MIDPYRMIVVNLILSIFLLGGIGIYRFIYPKKPLNLFVILILVSLLPIVSIARKGTYEAGDLSTHSIELRNFYENLQSGTILPIWAQHFSGEHGSPTFLTQYIFPYYLGSFFHLLGFGFVSSLKMVLATSFVVSGITMYIFLKEELEEKAAFVGSLFYLFAPYHLIDLHFRASVGEVSSFMFPPLLFYFYKKLIETQKFKYVFLAAATFTLLITSHSSVTLATTFILAGYTLISISKYKSEKIKKLILTAVAFCSGILLSLFYVLPAYFEGQLTTYARNITPGDWKPIAQYLFSPIQYGFLFQGHQGEVRLIVGYAHLLILGFALYLLWKRKIDKKNRLFLSFLLVCFSIFFFMMLSVSKPIWSIPLLKSFMLVWRMLVPIAFITGIAAAIVSKYINKKLLFLICFFVVFSTILNWGNRKMVPETNAVVIDFYSEYFEPGNPVYIKRYANFSSPQLPAMLKLIPKSPIKTLQGNVSFSQIKRTPTYHEYIIDAKTNSTIKENTYYFPGWTVKIDGKMTKINYQDNKNFGIILFDIPKGLHKVEINFGNTKLRSLSQLISLFSLFSLLILTLALRKKRL